MTWPDDDAGTDQKDAQGRFHDLTDEICANVFALTKWQIADAFVRVANEVLTRERNRGDGSPSEREEVSVVAVVTIEQGRTFADSWIARARQSEIPDEAFAAARVMTWPEGNPKAQARFHAIMDDILARFWRAIRKPMAEAFVDAANHVIRDRP